MCTKQGKNGEPIQSLTKAPINTMLFRISVAIRPNLHETIVVPIAFSEPTWALKAWLWAFNPRHVVKQKASVCIQQFRVGRPSSLVLDLSLNIATPDKDDAVDAETVILAEVQFFLAIRPYFIKRVLPAELARTPCWAPVGVATITSASTSVPVLNHFPWTGPLTVGEVEVEYAGPRAPERPPLLLSTQLQLEVAHRNEVDLLSNIDPDYRCYFIHRFQGACGQHFPPHFMLQLRRHFLSMANVEFLLRLTLARDGIALSRWTQVMQSAVKGARITPEGKACVMAGMKMVPTLVWCTRFVDDIDVYSGELQEQPSTPCKIGQIPSGDCDNVSIMVVTLYADIMNLLAKAVDAHPRKRGGEWGIMLYRLMSQYVPFLVEGGFKTVDKGKPVLMHHYYAAFQSVDRLERLCPTAAMVRWKCTKIEVPDFLIVEGTLATAIHPTDAHTKQCRVDMRSAEQIAIADRCKSTTAWTYEAQYPFVVAMYTRPQFFRCDETRDDVIRPTEILCCDPTTRQSPCTGAQLFNGSLHMKVFGELDSEEEMIKFSAAEPPPLNPLNWDEVACSSKHRPRPDPGLYRGEGWITCIASKHSTLSRFEHLDNVCVYKLNKGWWILDMASPL